MGLLAFTFPPGNSSAKPKEEFFPFPFRTVYVNEIIL